MFLSLIFATREEIGYDITVQRVKFGGKICYVYKMGTEQAPQYFRTTKLLFTPRVLCITGRKTRVWEAIEVEGWDDDKLGKVVGDAPVALKDGWLDKGSRTEEEIQQAIFASLEGAKKKRYTWVPEELRQVLGDALQVENYKNYFMEIIGSGKFTTTKSRAPAAVPEPSILGSTAETPPTSSKCTVEGSIQDKDRSGLPSGYEHISSEQLREGLPPRKYQTKQQHRLIYRDVGCPLHDAKDIKTSFIAIRDTCIGACPLTCCVLVTLTYKLKHLSLCILLAGHTATSAPATSLSSSAGTDLLLAS